MLDSARKLLYRGAGSRPFFALLDPGAVVAVRLVIGKPCEQAARDIGTFPTVDEALVLAADRDRTFSVEGISICLDTAAAAVAFFPRAVRTMQTAS